MAGHQPNIVPNRTTGIALCLLVVIAVQCHEAPRGSALILSPQPSSAVATIIDADSTDARRRLAVEDPLAFLRLCRRNYDTAVQDYRCTFLKQERIGGHLGPEQEISVMFRESPFSVDMRWVRNAGRAKHANYVAGRWQDDRNREEALFRPSGLLGLLAPEVRRPIHGESARRESRRTIDEFGFKNSLDLIIKYCDMVKDRQGYELRYMGEGEVDCRATYVFHRLLPYTGQGGKYPDAMLMVHIDQKWLVPVACVAYADQAGEHLLGSYIQTNVEYNPGLTDADFERAAQGL